jgi:hypothetical protein
MVLDACLVMPIITNRDLGTPTARNVPKIAIVRQQDLLVGRGSVIMERRALYVQMAISKAAAEMDYVLCAPQIAFVTQPHFFVLLAIHLMEPQDVTYVHPIRTSLFMEITIALHVRQKALVHQLILRAMLAT